MVRGTWTAVVAVVALGAFSACDAKGAQKPAPTQYDTPAQVVWQQPLDVIGQPVVADGVAVVLATRKKKLRLHAFDVATGEQLWTATSTPSMVGPGAVHPSLVKRGKDTWVAHLSPPKDRTGPGHDLRVADLRTGRGVARVRNHFFGTSPSPCHDGNDVCVLAQGRGTEAGNHRLRVVEKTWVREPDGPSGTRVLDASIGLALSRSEDAEKLVRVVDGKVAWRLPVTEAFPKGASTGYGWVFRHRAEANVLVGTVVGGYEDADDESTVVRVSKLRVAGIDATTGDVLWRRKGILCLGGPDGPDGRSRDDVDVRCRDTAVGKKVVDGPWRWSEVHATVEGFDPRTGRTTWSYDLGAGARQPLATRQVVHAGVDQVAVVTHEGPVVLDLRDGSHRAPVEGEVFACPVEKSFTYRWVDGNPDEDVAQNGTDVVKACDAHGKPVNDPLGHHAVDAVAQRSGDLRLVSIEGALVAYSAEPSAPTEPSATS